MFTHRPRAPSLFMVGPLGLPRIKSPYNTAAADAGLSRDMSRDAALDESESRALYAITYIDGDK